MRGRLLDAGVLAVALAALGGTGSAVDAPARRAVPAIEAVPVELRPVAPRVRLTVHTFPAPRSVLPSPDGGDACADANSQSRYALFARGRTGGMAFEISGRYAPRSVWATAEDAMLTSLGAWNAALGRSYFTARRNDAAPARAARDGVNAIGWARLRPGTTLATTWTYTDAGGRIIESDVFFNTAAPWSVLSACDSVAAFDLENVATHELGHALGLDHVGDPGGQATMYPTSPSGEIRKRSLTSGDRAGAVASVR